MKREKLGSNTFKWVKKCKGAQVCVDLPYYGGMIGACSIKVRSHYDGESCSNDNKCTSGVCGGTKCKGKSEGERCESGLGQCKKGLLCRNEVDENGDLRVDTNGATIYNFTCQKPIDDEGKCGDEYFHGQNLDDDFTIFNEDLFDPAQNPCKLGSVCSNEKCVKIGSVSDTILSWKRIHQTLLISVWPVSSSTVRSVTSTGAPRFRVPTPLVLVSPPFNSLTSMQNGEDSQSSRFAQVSSSVRSPLRTPRTPSHKAGVVMLT
jgi:hypothetical protein